MGQYISHKSYLPHPAIVMLLEPLVAYVFTQALSAYIHTSLLRYTVAAIDVAH